MSKPIRRSFSCSSGHTFDADVFRSANVTLQPDLKDEIRAGRFNRVRCPVCGEDQPADVPYLYHDMDAGHLIWVYPRSSRDQAAAIRDKVRKSREIISTVLPVPTPEAEPDVAFGLDDLLRLLDDPASP
jgi:hypothetical protein